MMLNNRIGDWFDAPETRAQFATEDVAFVQVPTGLLFSSAQQAQVAALYQMAAERARRDMERRSSPLPRFSLN